MTTAELLRDLERLDNSARLRFMDAFGNQARADPAAAAILVELSEMGYYERRLALAASSFSGDGSLPLKMLSDCSRVLRRDAYNLVPHLCNDEQIVEALEIVSHRLRPKLLERLRQLRRLAPIDTYLDRLAAQCDLRLGETLSYGSEAAVRRHIDAVMPCFSESDWRRLALRHPDIALEALLSRADSLTAPDVRLRHHVNATLPDLAESRPDAALRLAQAVLRHASLSQIELQNLANRRPNEVAELVLGSDDWPKIEFRASVYELSRANLLALVQHRPKLLGSPRQLLRRSSPEIRRAIYDLAAVNWRNDKGILDFDIAALLPGELRAEEGRRHLALPALATRPAERLPYAALLPWDEAVKVLEPGIHSSDTETRCAAITALIGAVRYQPKHLHDALAVVLARANEQDSVRRAMLHALASLPQGRWKTEHLDDLGQIIRDALSAADLSPLTAREAERLIVALVPFHPDWAAQWLSTPAQQRGEIHSHDFETRLRDDDARRISAALVEAMGDEREQEAMFALPSGLLEMPPARALAILVGIPMENVTEARKVVRLIGQLRTPDAYRALHDLDEQPLHSDVRAALLRALWNDLEDDATWEKLNRAAADPDPSLARGVIRVPTDRLSPVSQGRLVNLIGTLLEHPDPQVRMNVLLRCARQPVSDHGLVLLPRLVAGLGSVLTDETYAAAHAIFATDFGSHSGAVGNAIRSVRENRWVLHTSVLELRNALLKGRQYRTGATMLGALKAIVNTAVNPAEMYLTDLLWDEAVVHLTKSAKNDELHAEALMAAAAAIKTACSRSDGALELLEAIFAGSYDEHLRHLALASLMAQVKIEGWTDLRITRRWKFSRDSSPLVSTAANFKFPDR